MSDHRADFVDSTPEERANMTRWERVKDELRWDVHLLAQREVLPVLALLVAFVALAAIVAVL